MANYKFTDVAGTSRRRARQIVIENPSQVVGATTDTGNQASVTFVMEDRIIMADGTEMFQDVGLMTVQINQDTLSKLYPNYDVQTGNVSGKPIRSGAAIVGTIMDGLEDVFITEGMKRDELETLSTEPSGV